MIVVKEMTYSKKYSAVLSFLRIIDSFALPVINKHMGYEGIDKLNILWQENLKVIPNDISDKDKYETAYSNFMWKGAITYKFVKEHLDENGIEEFKRAEIETWKRKDSRLKMLILKGIRVISSGTAFSMIEKQMVNDFQVFSPAIVTELNKERLVFDIPNCKLLDYPECEDVCLIGCQEIFPKLFAEHLKVKMDTDRRGKSCTVTLTPLG